MTVLTACQRMTTVACTSYILLLLVILMLCREIQLDVSTYAVMMAALTSTLLPNPTWGAMASVSLAAGTLAYYVRAAPCQRLQLHSRVCIVTGAAGPGIGQYVAIALAKMGATVVVTAQTSELARETAMRLRDASNNPNVFPEVMDLTNRHKVERCAVALRTRFPVIDMLINNAGLMQSGGKCTPDGVDEVVAVNYVGPYLFTRLLLPSLLAAEKPTVVNVGSSTQRYANHFDVSLLPCGNGNAPAPRGLLAAYSQSKLGVLLFTAALRRRHRNLRAVAVHPGFVNTNITRHFPAMVQNMYAALLPIMSAFHKRPSEGAATILRAAFLPLNPHDPDTLFYTPTGIADYPLCARSKRHIDEVWHRTEMELKTHLRPRAPTQLSTSVANGAESRRTGTGGAVDGGSAGESGAGELDHRGTVEACNENRPNVRARSTVGTQPAIPGVDGGTVIQTVGEC